MEPLHEALRLIERTTELECAMRRPGGIRITEERELQQLRRALAEYPEAVDAVRETVSRMRMPARRVVAERAGLLSGFQW
jgi:hypothetical protein